MNKKKYTPTDYLNTNKAAIKVLPKKQKITLFVQGTLSTIIILLGALGISHVIPLSIVNPIAMILLITIFMVTGINLFYTKRIRAIFYFIASIFLTIFLVLDFLVSKS